MVKCTYLSIFKFHCISRAKLFFCTRNIDQVDRTMDDIREQMDIANEINDAISQPLGDPIDEASIFLRA